MAQNLSDTKHSFDIGSLLRKPNGTISLWSTASYFLALGKIRVHVRHAPHYHHHRVPSYFSDNCKVQKWIIIT
jgi:hypothetical protein